MGVAGRKSGRSELVEEDLDHLTAFRPCSGDLCSICAQKTAKRGNGRVFDAFCFVFSI